MERKGSAKKWGGLFKLFGRTETDTNEEGIETEEALNSAQEETINKEIEVQEIYIETNPEHSASASENVTSNQQFSEVTKELGGLVKLFASTETDTKEEDIETEEALNSVQEKIMNKEEEAQEINIETNTEHSASASENITPNQQFAKVAKEYRLNKLRINRITSTNSQSLNELESFLIEKEKKYINKQTFGEKSSEFCSSRIACWDPVSKMKRSKGQNFV